MRKKKDNPPWVLIGAFVAGLWWLFSNPSTASAATPTVSAGGKKYLDQILTAQSIYPGNYKSQPQYVTMVQSLLLAAQLDSSVSTNDMAVLRATAGV
jgi:hypothetical protein